MKHVSRTDEGRLINTQYSKHSVKKKIKKKKWLHGVRVKVEKEPPTFHYYKII